MDPDLLATERNAIAVRDTRRTEVAALLADFAKRAADNLAEAR